MLKTPLFAPIFGFALACVAEPGPGAGSLEDPRSAEDPLDPAVSAAPTRTPEPAATDAATPSLSADDIAWLPPEVRRHGAAIDEAAARHGVDPRLVAIVVLVESGGRPDAVSPIGARGLMQLMPATASDIARRHDLAPPTREALEQIEGNLDLGVRLLAELIEDFGDPSLDADSVHRVATAYNGGSGVVLQHREPSAETRHYADEVVRLWIGRDDLHRP